MSIFNKTLFNSYYKCRNTSNNNVHVLYVTMLLLHHKALSFWPPPYKAEFKHHEDFVISADASFSEEDEEMLKEDDITSLNLDLDNSKLERLHRQFKHSEISTSPEGNVQFPVPVESYDMEDFSLKIRKRTLGPNPLKDNIQHQNVDKRFANKSNEEGTEQYDEEGLEVILKSSTQKPPKQYDYESFRSDYYNEVQEALHSNTSFNYTKTDKYEESIGDAVNEIVDFKKPRNCSKEEDRNFGIKSFECLWDDFKNLIQKWTNKTLEKTSEGSGYMVMIYIAIAVPCWCKFGLCCCCCRCSFCRPRRLMNKAKKYVATNRPGVLVEDGTEKQHEPTIYETEAYNKLLHSIRKL